MSQCQVWGCSTGRKAGRPVCEEHDTPAQRRIEQIQKAAIDVLKGSVLLMAIGMGLLIMAMGTCIVRMA